MTRDATVADVSDRRYAVRTVGWWKTLPVGTVVRHRDGAVAVVVDAGRVYEPEVIYGDPRAPVRYQRGRVDLPGPVRVDADTPLVVVLASIGEAAADGPHMDVFAAVPATLRARIVAEVRDPEIETAVIGTLYDRLAAWGLSGWHYVDASLGDGFARFRFERA